MSMDGLFRRYQRWNPVHPTYGAFWGMGIGVGCGVGWGPGYGPESVGFVGSGCGLGFSVGLTFIGFGLGLPAHGFISLPYQALTSITYEALNLMKMGAPLVVDASNRGLTSLSCKASEMQMNIRQSIARNRGLTSLSCKASEMQKNVRQSIARNRGLTSLSCKASEMQENVRRSIGNIRSTHLLMEAKAKRQWISMEARVTEWDKNLKHRAFRSFKILTSKGRQHSSGGPIR